MNAHHQIVSVHRIYARQHPSWSSFFILPLFYGSYLKVSLCMLNNDVSCGDRPVCLATACWDGVRGNFEAK